MDNRARSESGYAMAVLLVSLSVMAVLMTAAMPVWKQMAQREKETELVFRGEQYARAIGLFQRKNGPGSLPPSIDALVEQHFLRKKYKDPITNGDFAPIQANAVTPAGVAPPAGPGQGGGRGNTQSGRGQTAGTGQPAQDSRSQGTTFGNVAGVASKSKDKSIRVYNGRDHYNEWQFLYVPPTPSAGATPGAPNGGGGQRGRGPGGSPNAPGAPSRGGRGVFRGAPPPQR